ncbi:aminopeptidase N [Prauserella isguenensis]|uniref:Aminopeptidase N n=1 Tax=Prauserella isguenensis TaxID=1470180 RepID=A0A839RX38_9PSEU|nr:M1 family metallopeptidase [Prauserella isguenensis]MBB3050208.1 aminopeptidase N [Prauserella isguenensis]
MAIRRAGSCVLALVCTLAACTSGGDEPRSTAPQRTPATSAGESAGALQQRRAEPGAPGIGDPYYPEAGNGGYDAQDYDVSVRYDPDSGVLHGDSTMTARATKPLSRFNLDLRGMTVESVHVDGVRTRFDREGAHELVITPERAKAGNQRFRVRVQYHGTPERTASGLGSNGWHRTPSGGAFAMGEPPSASFWYPSNDHPRDKATFRLTARVPQGWTAVSIGREEQTTTRDGWTTSRWVEPEPVAGYLTTVAIDRFDVTRRTLDDGTPMVNAFAPGSEDLRPEARRTGEIVRFLESRFGDYPATTTGGIYLGADIGYALETQGRPTYDAGATLSTIVHELAHQWYGNEVSVSSWADICLNECFASYAQWLWDEGKEGADLDVKYHKTVAAVTEEFWDPPLYDMGAGDEFQGVYGKGILAMHALRRQLGEEAFWRVMRSWPREHREGNASWPEFERFVERIYGRSLDGFFAEWFHRSGLPDEQYLYPGTLSN